MARDGSNGCTRWVSSVAIAASMMLAACAEGAAPITTYAYVREMSPGLPDTQAQHPTGARQGYVLPAEYFLYVEVAPGRQVAASWLSLRGQYHGCALQKVASPVLIDSDSAVPTGQKETLVPKTANNVYQVAIGASLTQVPAGAEARKLAAEYDAVVAMMVDGSVTYAVAKSLRALRPKAGM